MNPIVTKIEHVEEIIGSHEEHMGDQFLPYKNHVYRVLNFCFMFGEPSSEEIDKLAIGAAFHDLGMWPGDQIDYLDPSIELARDYLRRTKRENWIEEISLMIEFHHRFRKCPKRFPHLVEIFRKGDWVDATKGLRRFGLAKSGVRRVQDEIENLGFHANLIRIAKKEFWKRPFKPLPMMKW
ncbi:MAG: HD domain-containing protein [Coraliomargarita sp.]